MSNIHQYFLVFFVVILLAFIPTANAQKNFCYNLTTENGLPSNHIYGILKDRHGYLWFATPKGVAKYNGYEFKIFGIKEGLPNEDVWQLFEDKKGRIWTINIGEEMGYLYNDKYHKAILENIKSTIYPDHIRGINDGIIFSSTLLYNSFAHSICIEHNDTITAYKVDDSVYARSGSYSGFIYIKKGSEVGLYSCGKLYKLVRRGNSFVAKSVIDVDTINSKVDLTYNIGSIQNDIIVYPLPTSYKQSIGCLFANTGKGYIYSIDTLNMSENIEHTYNDPKDESSLYIITKNNVLKLEIDSVIHYVKIYKIYNLIKNVTNGKDIRVFSEDEFWGAMIGSNSFGTFINCEALNHFKKINNVDFSKYSYTGGVQDKISFWWNKSTSKLAKIEEGYSIKYFNYKSLGDLKLMYPYNDDTFWATGFKLNKIHFLNSRSGQYFMPSKNNVFLYNLSKINQPRDLRMNSKTDYLYLDTRTLGRISLKNNNVIKDVISTAKYFEIVYNPVKTEYWAYNASKILVYNSIENIAITKDKFDQFGISLIEKIVIDAKYGNIIVKGNTKHENVINLYNFRNNVAIPLFKNYNIDDAKLLLYNDILIAAGRFGVLFCLIKGLGDISEPILYSNVKDINYKNIEDVVPSWNKVLLNTDKGLYTVDIPSDSEFKNYSGKNTLKYKLIFKYRGLAYNIKNSDTVNLNQDDLRMQFDIINPYGNGKVLYSYKLSNDSIWHDLNSNELTLPQSLSPGIHYVISLKINDAVWRSDVVNLNIYIRPYWWQLLLRNKVFWVFVITVIVAVIAAIIYISNRIITKNQIKKNLRLGLELKSVYAQINPHFIFNTLGTAMYFVKEEKTDEAYAHLAKFSRLLRAYIKSARNRYISIAAEIENLNNYIQLQQVRFEDKFDYQIIVNDDVNKENTEIPSLLLQPIVENAIDHGIFHKEGKGVLKIIFEKGENEYEINCIIDDDGIGREKSRLIAKESIIKTESYGEKLIEDLVTIFNKYEKARISIKYVDKVPPLTGTTVIINIQYPKNER